MEQWGQLILKNFAAGTSQESSLLFLNLCFLFCKVDWEESRVSGPDCKATSRERSSGPFKLSPGLPKTKSAWCSWSRVFGSAPATHCHGDARTQDGAVVMLGPRSGALAPPLPKGMGSASSRLTEPLKGIDIWLCYFILSPAVATWLG